MLPPASRYGETAFFKGLPIASTEVAILSESEESGVYMVASTDGREFFLTGHSEYSPETLDNEYKRDLSKNLPIEMPQNYYMNNNPDNNNSLINGTRNRNR